MRMLRALFTFSAVFSILLSYRPLSFFCLFIPNSPSFFPILSIIGTAVGVGRARSLPRLAVHSPMPLPFVVIVHETLSAQIFTTEIAMLLYSVQEKPGIEPHISDECTGGGYRSGSENSTLSLERTCMRLLSWYMIHIHTHAPYTYIRIYTWAHMSKLQCHSVRITYTLVQKRMRSNDEVTKQKKSRFTIGYL